MSKKIRDKKSNQKRFMAKFSQSLLTRFVRKSKVMGYFKIVRVLAVGITLSAIHKVFALPPKKSN